MRKPTLITRSLWLCLIAVACSFTSLRADVKLPAIFTSHMVLQQDKPLPVWGWAAPGEEVTVSFGDAKATTKADEKGNWKVSLPAQKRSLDPRVLSVVGKNTINVEDVLVGEVWICSGQSNMQWTVSRSANAPAEIAAANYPSIRLFAVPLVPAGTPAPDVNAKWEQCSPATVAEFSAVAYFFGRELHKELGGAPIGMIRTAWGGTRIEPWTPPVGFESVPATNKELDVINKGNADFRAAQTAYVTQVKDWVAASEAALAAGNDIAPTPPFPVHPLNSNRAHTGLYNGMVHALVPFAFRGALWYQGESNRMDGYYYADLKEALVTGWRKTWNQGDFPFYYVQIAPFNYGKDAPTKLAELWEGQTDALRVPNTGIAGTCDIGDLKDIHPVNKQEVGRRLALWALAKDYGKTDLVFSGPMYDSIAVEGNKIRVKFKYSEGGLVSRDNQPLTWFLIAGEDKKFVKANATIEGNDILVDAAGIDKPVAVRFGWHQFAEPNLANKAGLPAIPFRSDNWEDASVPQEQ